MSIYACLPTSLPNASIVNPAIPLPASTDDASPLWSASSSVSSSRSRGSCQWQRIAIGGNRDDWWRELAVALWRRRHLTGRERTNMRRHSIRGQSNGGTAYGLLRSTLTEALADAAFAPLARQGLWLEFGVYDAMSTNLTSRYLAQVPGVGLEATVEGFDTFTGLPERWLSFPAGSFSWASLNRGEMPPVQRRVRLHKGLFKDTVGGFLRSQPAERPVAWVSVDCDLEAGARDALAMLGARLRPGTRLHLHELLTFHDNTLGRVMVSANSNVAVAQLLSGKVPPLSDEARALHAWLESLPVGVELELLPVASYEHQAASLVVRRVCSPLTGFCSIGAEPDEWWRRHSTA